MFCDYSDVNSVPADKDSQECGVLESKQSQRGHIVYFPNRLEQLLANLAAAIASLIYSLNCLRLG